MTENEQTLREKFVSALTATVELYDSILEDTKRHIAALEKENERLWEETRMLRYALDELHKRISAHESLHDAQKPKPESEQA